MKDFPILKRRKGTEKDDRIINEILSDGIFQLDKVEIQLCEKSRDEVSKEYGIPKHLFDKVYILEFIRKSLLENTISQISNVLGYKKKTVQEYIIKYNLRSSVKNNLANQIKDLCHQGYSDGIIAKKLNISRYRVLRLRKAHGYESKRGRGLAKLKTEALVINEAKRVLRDPIINRFYKNEVIQLVKEIRSSDLSPEEKNRKEKKAWCSTIIEPMLPTQQKFSPHVKAVDRMNYKDVYHIIDIEHKNELIGMFGSPSTECLDYLIENSRNEMGIERITLQKHILDSTLLGEHQTVKSARGNIGNYDDIQRGRLCEAEEFINHITTKKEEIKHKAEKTHTAQVFNIRTSSGGKKGKGGGYQSIHNNRAFAAAKGY